MICLFSSFYKVPDNILQYFDNSSEAIISFIASDFSNYEKTDKYTRTIMSAFNDKNIKFKEVVIIDNRITKDEMKRYLSNSDFVFLHGGDTLKQIKYIKGNELDIEIKKVKNIMGVSAGAINLAKIVVLARDITDNIPKLSIYEGVGVTDINIEPHFNFYDDIHLKDIIEASFNSKIIVMAEDTYILIDKNKEKIFGNYLEAFNGIFYLNNKEMDYEDFRKRLQK